MNAGADIRARHAPVAIVLVFLWELAWALLVATPVHAWAHRTWGSHPDGDAVLFRPGGRELVSWIGALDDASVVVLRTTLLLLFVGALVSQIPLGALVGVVADLARVAIARDVAERDPDAPPRSSLSVLRTGLRAAIATARRALARAFFAWTWRALASVLLLVFASWVGTAVGGRGGFLLFSLFVFHQVIVLLRTALRASWLANALRLVSLGDQR